MGKRCAYCGREPSKLDREHPIPACLYPKSKGKSRVQRITVPACRMCNASWADDEPHFRNVLLIAGEPNAAVHELWKTTARRGFNQVDGRRRLLDLAKGLVPVTANGQDRWMIYPGRDHRVLRVVRKVIRGLSHHHHVETAIGDNRVWADVLKYPIPSDLISSVQFHHRVPDVIEYWYEICSDVDDLSSVWFLRFFERRMFIGAVKRRAVGRPPTADQLP